MEPIFFREIFKEKIWGGQNLARLLEKDLPADKKIGESWDLADFGEDCSVVAQGPLKGRNLRQLLAEHSRDIIGTEGLAEFPLLFKFLDATQTLSIQVHPHKHESWYIIEARPEAKLYLGVKKGVGREQFQAALTEDSLERCLESIEPAAGQCYYLPSGLTHALGAGLVVAEIQTPEQITYRVYDWHRGRPIQVQLSLETINFSARPQVSGPLSQEPGQTRRILDCPLFSIDRAVWPAGQTIDLAPEQMQVWMILAGRARCGGLQMHKGQTTLIPASCENRVTIDEQFSVLIARSKDHHGNI